MRVQFQESPPHVRGKERGCAHWAHPLGITPACAGKSLTEFCGNTGRKDHPRMCGEKIYSVRDNIAEQGSPPHVRGKDGCTVALAYGHRITPACAGKSRFAAQRGILKRDHPRMCGEKSCDCASRMPRQGSPPHVRGKGFHSLRLPPHAGITPACAGKRG